MLDPKIEQSFLDILKEELIPAMGCTEPIALAYAAARLTEVLGRRPDQLCAKCSGNMIKNVRCVQIPHSDGMTGIEAAVTLGAFGGDASRMMEVLSAVGASDIADTRSFLLSGGCTVEYLDSDIPLHFIIEGCAGRDSASVEIRHSHTQITRIIRNGDVVFAQDTTATDEQTAADRSQLNIDNIKAFADEVAIEKIAPIFERSIRMNMDIAYEGMSGSYGLGIGKILKENYPDSCLTRIKAYTAAASEARMGGCNMPVIITSGSGNQGITSSVPVIVYCREHAVPHSKMLRAMALASLLTIEQKEYIGKLSAFCGAVSAACASGAAITYLCGGTAQQISDTITNTMADIPGIICDGAKVACAAKIASCLDAAIMAHKLAMQDKVYAANTGILQPMADDTIACVGYVGRVGMRQTDKEILRIMVGTHGES